MLISAFVTSGLVPVEASNPHQGTLTLYFMHDTMLSGRYDAILNSFKEEFAKIGITIKFYGQFFDWDELPYDWYQYWNYTWADNPGYGWDLALGQFWGMPTDLQWFSGMYSAAGMPPYGWNMMGWNNTKADELLANSIRELDVAKRREYILLWQKEYVHDNPAPILYSPVFVEVSDARFQTTWGTSAWDPALDSWDFFLCTWVEDPMPDKVVLKVGVKYELYGLNPMFMWDYAQSYTQAGATHNMLYTVSKTPGSLHGEGYIIKPVLAVDEPIWLEDGKKVDVYLRNDVYWHNFTDIYTDPGNPVEYNNELFTADDVVFTFDTLMDPYIYAWGSRDYMDVLNISVFPGGVEKMNDYHVRFHLLEPYAPFETLLANTWAVLILPEHIMGSVPMHARDWDRHWTNTVHPPPGTGPFKWVEGIPSSHWKLEVNPAYPEALGGQHVIDEITFDVITDPADGWTALTNHEIHFGDCWEATPAQLEAARLDPTLDVFDAPIPATFRLMFNLHHPVLSNRYVRQAIAHAINYPHIINDILPTQGLKGTLQATPVWPNMEWAYPTPADEDTYNLEPYEYNIDIANQYMDMYRYSLVGTDYTLGPIGDGDFSGYVEPIDFTIWANRIVKGQLTPGTWPWSPGRDIDPDFDNTGFVDLDDFYAFRDESADYYPFYGAR